MLYHSIINGRRRRTAKKVIQKERTQNHHNIFYEKVRAIAKELNTKLEAAVTIKKSERKRRIKDKVQNKVEERVENEMKNKT